MKKNYSKSDSNLIFNNKQLSYKNSNHSMSLSSINSVDTINTSENLSSDDESIHEVDNWLMEGVDEIKIEPDTNLTKKKGTLTIDEILLTSPLFQHLSKSQIKNVINSLQFVSYKKDDIIINEGEYGDKLYIIKKGTVSVNKLEYINNKNINIMLTHLHKGYYFGELALLYNNKRTATIKAVDDVDLIYLNRDDFLNITDLKLSIMLSQVSLLKQLNYDNQKLLIDKFKTIVYKDNEYIIKQGDIGDKFIIITHGEALVTEAIILNEVTRKTDYSKLKQLTLTKIYTGNSIGEMSLIENKRCIASIKALGNVRGVYLSKEDFNICMKDDKFKQIITNNINKIKNNRKSRDKTHKLKTVISEYNLLDKTNIISETNIVKKEKNEKGETILNKYIIKKMIGEGQYGKVYLVQHKDTNELYAMKKINKKYSNLLSQINMLIKNEIEIMKKLNHKNIIKLIEVINDPISKYYYIIQEYISRGNINDVLNTIDAIDENIIRKYMHSIIHGVSYLHYNNIIHRDIKPDNLLIDNNDNIKITDFGTANIFKSEYLINNNIQGTPAFMAPEVFNIEYSKINEAIDIWSIGVTLYLIVTNQLPWDGKNDMELLNNIKTKELTFPDNKFCRIEITPNLKNLLERMLDKQQETRITLKQIALHEWITNESSVILNILHK